jgi:thioredoxin-related protein
MSWFENGFRIARAARARNDKPAVVILANARTHFDATAGLRRLPQTLFSLLLLFLCGLLAAHAADTRDAASFFNLNMGDLKTELAEAKADGKKALMVMFEQEGCPGCLYMKRNILNRKDVQDYYRANFANLSLDIWSSVPVRDFANREQTEKAYAQAAKVKGTPTFVFYDLAGNEVVRILGTIETPDEFLLLAQFVASGAYKTRSFAQYKTDQPRKGS